MIKFSLWSLFWAVILLVGARVEGTEWALPLVVVAFLVVAAMDWLTREVSDGHR